MPRAKPSFPCGLHEQRLAYWHKRRSELEAMLMGRLPDDRAYDMRCVRRALGWVEDAIQRIEARP